MSTQIRKKHPSSFKAKVAVEALKGFKTLAEISSEYKIHSNQISQWKKKLLEGIPREALRTAALDCWKRWTAAGVDVTWEATVLQEHLDSWPELKISGIDITHLFIQGSEFYARTLTQEAIESVSAHPTLGIGCSCC